MILYILQIHHKTEQIPQIIDLLDASTSEFIINIDPHSAIAAEPIIKYLQDRGISRSVVRRGTPITWAGISQVHSWIDVLKFALSWSASWEHVINLSGECLPLVPQSHICEFLDRSSRDGHRAHMWFYHPRLRQDTYCLARCGEALAIDSTAKSLPFYSRVPALIQKSVAGVFPDERADPLSNWELRGSIHVTDLVLAKKLVIRRLYPFEAEHRRNQLNRIPLGGGRAWYLLRRDAVDDALSDPLMPEIVDMLQHYLCPDELFMQTLVRNSSRFRPDEIRSRNAHFRQGDPVWVTDDLADEILASGAFFARKVAFDRSPQLLDRVRRIIL